MHYTVFNMQLKVTVSFALNECVGLAGLIETFCNHLKSYTVLLRWYYSRYFDVQPKPVIVMNFGVTISLLLYFTLKIGIQNCYV